MPRRNFLSFVLKKVRQQMSWTGGQFACACVYPLNNSSVVASHLMAGNWKIAYSYSTFLKPILWCFNYCTFLQRNFLQFFISSFSRPFKDLTLKISVFCTSIFSRQCNYMVCFFFRFIYLYKSELMFYYARFVY